MPTEDIEANLLLLMTTPEALKAVAEEHLSAEAFETPIHRSVFTWMREYWTEHYKPPTIAMLSTEFPGLNLAGETPETVSEDVDWLIDWLGRRYATNIGQKIMLEAAKTCHEDPKASLRKLSERAAEAADLLAIDPWADVAFDQEVAQAKRLLLVKEEARRRVQAAKNAHIPPFEARLLADVGNFDPDRDFRIPGLIPCRAGSTIVAQNKTGKTTLMINLIYSLLTGEEFLGQFEVHKVNGNVAVLNYEVTGEQFAYWARQIGVPEDRLWQVDLRGRRNPFAYPEDLKRLAELLVAHDVESLIVDPFGQAFSGTNQNDPAEVSRWLGELDRFTRGMASVSDLFLTVHAGWAGDRARGASSLGDWPDVSIFLTRTDSGDRFISALGRDVNLDEDKLDYDPKTRRLMLSGAGGRKQVRKDIKADLLVLPVYQYVGAHHGCNTTEIVKAMREMAKSGQIDVRFQDDDVRQAIRKAEGDGLLWRTGLEPGRPTRHFPVEAADPRGKIQDREPRSGGLGVPQEPKENEFDGSVQTPPRSTSSGPHPDLIQGEDVSNPNTPSNPVYIGRG